MNIFVWNVRGMHTKERRKDVKDLIHKFKSSIIGLVETKVKLQKSRKVTDCIPQGWGHAHNYAYFSKGRIWVF